MLLIVNWWSIVLTNLTFSDAPPFIHIQVYTYKKRGGIDGVTLVMMPSIQFGVGAEIFDGCEGDTRYY